MCYIPGRGHCRILPQLPQGTAPLPASHLRALPLVPADAAGRASPPLLERGAGEQRKVSAGGSPVLAAHCCGGSNLLLLLLFSTAITAAAPAAAAAPAC